MYPDIFIEQRADPFITKGKDGFYYFTASYPAYLNVDSGYDRIILRRSKTVVGLQKAEERIIWMAHSQGIMAKHIWAPELHYIGGKWYVFFAAGSKDAIWDIRPYMIVCNGQNPYEDSWSELGKVQPCSEDTVSFNSFSLDMTHFEHRGKHYLIWAEIIGDSSLFMAEIDPEEPNKLISLPIMLSKPEFDWEKVRFRVNEGASVLKTDDKIYVFFSASGTGEEYCMGMLYADVDSDLLNYNSWIKVSTPVLETKDLAGEVGPGHNSFVTDENGKLLLIYHSRPAAHLTKACGTWCEESLYDPCRHARIREVKFDELGVPRLK